MDLRLMDFIDFLPDFAGTAAARTHVHRAELSERPGRECFDNNPAAQIVKNVRGSDTTAALMVRPLGTYRKYVQQLSQNGHTPSSGRASARWASM